MPELGNSQKTHNHNARDLLEKQQHQEELGKPDKQTGTPKRESQKEPFTGTPTGSFVGTLTETPNPKP